MFGTSKHRSSSARARAARTASRRWRGANTPSTQVLALQRENAALRIGARPPWASPSSDQVPPPGPALGSSAALDANEQTVLLTVRKTIFAVL